MDGDRKTVLMRGADVSTGQRASDLGVPYSYADGIPGREVVDPSDSNVLLSVPDHPGMQPTERLMTMTTCTPKFTAAQRMIVYAKLWKTYPAHGLKMPSAVDALYTAQES